MTSSRRRSIEEWTQIIKEHETSGQTAKEYCRSRSIGLASFYQWRSRLQNGQVGPEVKMSSTGSFIELGQIDSTELTRKASMSPWMVTLDFGEGFKLTLQRV